MTTHKLSGNVGHINIIHGPLPTGEHVAVITDRRGRGDQLFRDSSVETVLQRTKAWIHENYKNSSGHFSADTLNGNDIEVFNVALEYFSNLK